MSDSIQHECGIAFMRLLKPINYYQEKSGDNQWPIDKMQSLMKKQINRGQDGCGIVNIKLDVPPGVRYISRYRSNDKDPLGEIFSKIYSKFNDIPKSEVNNLTWIQENIPFTGEVFLGHLRYGTYGLNNVENCHPFLRLNNWKSKNLTLAGNFNLTNVDELFGKLVEFGQHPKEKSDTVTILEKIGHHLDLENLRLYNLYQRNALPEKEIYKLIEENLDITEILKKSSADWDGGYVMCGIIGHGDSFILRDPNGIRPCYYYHDEDIFVAASERWAIQSTFDLDWSQIKELSAGNAVIVKRDGTIRELNINTPRIKKSCSFERIYFSKSNDPDIYNERKNLGRKLAKKVIEKIDSIENTIFSFIPQSSEIAFLGLVEEVGKLTSKLPRIEKLITKETKSRTFITNDSDRKKMVSSAYEIGGAKITNEDTLVLVDDSIVRGTTLKDSIISILQKQKPKKIIIVSSAPQVRYPDCYGIDMVRISDMIAFQAAISLLRQMGDEKFISQVYESAKFELTKPKNLTCNVVEKIYESFSDETISLKISQIISENSDVPVEVIYQSIEDLNSSIPNHNGDWYFTGDYPTYGGRRVSNQSFINYFEGSNKRAY